MKNQPMQQRSIAFLQQMGISVWRSREKQELLIPLLWVHDQPDQLQASPLWRGLIAAIQDEYSNIVITTPEKCSHYTSTTIIWTSEQPPESDERVSRYIWSELSTQGEQKRQLWQQVSHALYG
jgi:DNA polymerase III psi subunit